MPLGFNRGDVNESRYCGVETEFDDDVPHLLASNIFSGGFDFIVAPLMDPSYRPSLMQEENGVLPFAGSDLVLSPEKWRRQVIGKISSWIDLDSENEILRIDSETTLKQEIAWASHLSLKACLLPAPKGTSYVNYARRVHQILQGGRSNMQLWLSIPLAKIDNNSTDVKSHHSVDYWDMWNTFRLLCEHHSQLSVALNILSMLPSPNSLGRWFGEPVRAAIIRTDCFLTDSLGHPCLSMQHQKLITEFFNHSIQVVLSGKSLHNVSWGFTDLPEISFCVVRSHALRFYIDHVDILYHRINPLPDQEKIQFRFRDLLQAPLQPLMDNLESQTYVNFEKDAVKYNQYQRAIVKALKDRVTDYKASSITIVLMVVGAGRGPLVRAALQAAEETGRKLKVYAVEKNPSAVVTLHSLVKMKGWEKLVTIISCDMRHWDASEKADILVSELLGSFGDNELSPECLDGAQRFLKGDGISIPSSPEADLWEYVRYTSFLQPITASKLYSGVQDRKDLAHFESAYVVKPHNVARLSAPQPVFTFIHPNRISAGSNQRYKKLVFEIPNGTGAALVHGFVGYFDATLYDDIHLGIEPSTATPDMFSWFPIFFPLRTPMYVPPGSPVQLHFWRCCDPNKVWYEWCVTSPTQSPLHNCNGRSYWIGL